MHPEPSPRPVGPRDGGDQPGGHRGSGALPAWRRTTDGEQRWPAALTVLTAIALQLVLPSRLGLHPKYLLPGLETALLIALVIANPGRFNARRRLLRAGGLVMIGLVIAANAASATLLISDLLHSRGPTTNAGSLLTSAGDIYLTNIIAFGLLYWELDRRGPVARAHADIAHPDFMFPQMTNPDLARPHWAPNLGLPLPQPDQRHRLQPHRHHANDPPSQGVHGAAVRRRPTHRRTGHRPGHQHLEITQRTPPGHRALPGRCLPCLPVAASVCGAGPVGPCRASWLDHLMWGPAWLLG